MIVNFGAIGSYHGVSFGERGKQRSSSLTTLYPDFVNAITTSSVVAISGNPSPSSIPFLILTCSALSASYFFVKHHS